MKPYQSVENELTQHRAGWWKRVTALVPELIDLVGTPQPANYHAEGDVAIHTQLAVTACTEDDDPDLHWAALLHDIGKPMATKTEAGKITAHGHNAIGAEIAAKILHRLKMPKQRSDKIVWAIRHHTFHLSWNLKSPEKASKRHKRFMADPRFPFLLNLLRIDSMASLANRQSMQTYELYKQLYEKITGGNQK